MTESKRPYQQPPTVEGGGNTYQSAGLTPIVVDAANVRPYRPRWIVVFDQRAHQGLLRVGPFASPVDAHTWASLDTAGGEASWEVWELEPPENGPLGPT